MTMSNKLSSARSVLGQWLPAAFLVAVLLAVTGCKSIGPATVKRDRLHYSTAVAESWKEQLLLNIVKTRYGDAPAFLEVASLVSGYTLETGINVNGEFYPVAPGDDSFIGGELYGKFIDRPTISYLPMTGEKFARSFMSPVPLDALWSVIQGGAPADFLLGLTLHSMEGHHNLGLYAGQFQSVDPDFDRLLELMRLLQQAQAFDSELTKQADRLDVWVRFPAPESYPRVVMEQVAELKTLLHIPAETNLVRVTFGSRANEAGVVGVRTRSLMQILATLGAGVEIPAEHLARGGVVPVDSTQLPPGFTVHSGRGKPKQAFVSVPYEGHWFWIEQADLPSKARLATVTVLFNFLEGGGSKLAPVLTIPTN